MADDYFCNGRIEMSRVAMCVDCVLIVANGETSEPFDYDAWQNGVDRNWPQADGWHLGSGWDESDTEPWFSSQPCECCGSTLGGDREYGHAGRDVREERVAS